MILLVKNVNKLVNIPEDSNSKMVNRRREKDYIRKVIRISQSYIVICDFLDFYAGYKGKNKFEFYNDLFNYSLKKYPVMLALNLKDLLHQSTELQDHSF